MSKLTRRIEEEASLENILDRIKDGSIKLSVGDMLATHFKSGMEVDLVVTAIEDGAYRFESRDCLGRYTPMTRIGDFFAGVWDDLPDVLRDSIIETERPYSVGGETKSKTLKLFLPAASEIFPPASCYGDKGLYEQLDWYKDVQNRVRAYEKGGDADWYWTQSANSGSTTNFCAVTSLGDATAYNASNTNRAAPVCFRIPRF